MTSMTKYTANRVVALVVRRRRRGTPQARSDARAHQHAARIIHSRVKQFSPSTFSLQLQPVPASPMKPSNNGQARNIHSHSLHLDVTPRTGIPQVRRKRELGALCRHLILDAALRMGDAALRMGEGLSLPSAGGLLHSMLNI